MNKHAGTFSESDLRCDFPARESFRESLLERLLSMDESELAREREPQIIELSDSDLDLVAAAQSDFFGMQNPTGFTGSPGTQQPNLPW